MTSSVFIVAIVTLKIKFSLSFSLYGITFTCIFFLLVGNGEEREMRCGNGIMGSAIKRYCLSMLILDQQKYSFSKFLFSFIFPNAFQNLQKKIKNLSWWK